MFPLLLIGQQGYWWWVHLDIMLMKTLSNILPSKNLNWICCLNSEHSIGNSIWCIIGEGLFELLHSHWWLLYCIAAHMLPTSPLTINKNNWLPLACFGKLCEYLWQCISFIIYSKSESSDEVIHEETNDITTNSANLCLFTDTHTH